MNVQVTGEVIVQDRTAALEKQLKEDYEERLAKLKEEGFQAARALHEQIIAQANHTATARIAAEKERLRSEQEEQLTKARYEAQRAEEAHKQAYLQEAVTLVKDAIEHAPTKVKEQLIKRLHSDLKKTINEAGYDEHAFTYTVWRRAKIDGAKATLSDLRVKATKDYLSFEDSLHERLATRTAQIKQEALKQLMN